MPLLILLLLLLLRPTLSIFLLAGQSNMAGRGGVTNSTWDTLIPPTSTPSPSILRLSAELRWEIAREPLHADIDVNKTNGVGPGMAFAHAVVGRAGRVGLVPCAVGGTRVEEWGRGGGLYGKMVGRARVARRKGVVRGVLWFQGESDTVERRDAEEYKGRLERFVGDLRRDLGSPDLPFIQVALASGEGPFVDIVREAQKSIRLHNVVCVDAKGLPLEEDHLHLTTSSQVQLGKMLADAYLHHFAPPYH